MISPYAKQCLHSETGLLIIEVRRWNHVSENRGPRYRTLNSRTLIIRTPKEGTPCFRKPPYFDPTEYLFYKPLWSLIMGILGDHGGWLRGLNIPPQPQPIYKAGLVFRV